MGREGKRSVHSPCHTSLCVVVGCTCVYCLSLRLIVGIARLECVKTNAAATEIVTARATGGCDTTMYMSILLLVMLTFVPATDVSVILA